MAVTQTVMLHTTPTETAKHICPRSLNVARETAAGSKLTYAPPTALVWQHRKQLVVIYV